MSTQTENEEIKLGLSRHFQKAQWTKDQTYLDMYKKITQRNLDLHDSTVSTAFKNIFGFLHSVRKRDEKEGRKVFMSILDDDKNNLNALIGLETSPSPKDRIFFKESLKSVLDSNFQKRALAKALLEIGLALCLLIPKYEAPEQTEKNQDTDVDKPNHELNNVGHRFVFQTESVQREADANTDCNIVQKERVYSSIRYLEEGLHRLQEAEIDEKEILVWNFFLGMAYNRLDHWTSQTRGSSRIRRKCSLKALKLFCGIITEMDPDSDKFSKLYVQRSLAYVGQILLGRKHILLETELEGFIPACFKRVPGHFLANIWNNPDEAFQRALGYGYDAVVHTRHAKKLLHDSKFDEVIEIIDEVLGRDQSIHWYAASIRMRAYKLKHKKAFADAKEKHEFSSLDKTYLLKAEEDGQYCFDTYASLRDLLDYATVLNWLGTFPDGKVVTDPERVRESLHVLDRLYAEHGCHNHFKVHKQRAECHARLGELDEAIKYTSWSLNCYPDASDFSKPHIAFTLLIEYLLQKLSNQLNATVATTCNSMEQIKYHIITEISRCQEQISELKNQLPPDDQKRSVSQTQIERVWECLKPLLDRYDRRCLIKAEELFQSDPDGSVEQRQFVTQLHERYNCIFGAVNKLCRTVPEEVIILLDSLIKFNTDRATQTMVKMCLICLGKSHTNWTREFNKKWPRTEKKDLELFCPRRFAPAHVPQYDLLIIHAPEDKDWVFFELLPELEDRPKTFEACIPDRDFIKDLSFANNVRDYLNKTPKVLLIITPKFFERLYAKLEKTKIMSKVGVMCKEGKIDVMTVFAEHVLLDPQQANLVQLMEFENMKAWNRPVDWNFLRAFLLREPRLVETKRSPGIWDLARDCRHFNPRDIDDDKYLEILPYGLPEAMCLLQFSAYIENYDWERKIPRWVAHKIDSDTPRGVVSRKSHPRPLRDYKPEPRISPLARSSSKDFKQDKDITAGHMTPLADHSSTLALAKDTMFLTNIVPEKANLFFWNRLEEHCRDNLTKDFETVYVMSGTLFLATTHDAGGNLKINNSNDTDTFPRTTVEDGMEGNTNSGEIESEGIEDQIDVSNLKISSPGAATCTSKKVVTYQVVGRNEVAVPTHFFKIIMGRTPDREKPDKIGAFIIPNESLFDAELEDVEVPIKEVEKSLGINLFPTLNEALKKEKCSTLPRTFFTKKERMKKTIRYIDTPENLELVWKRLSSDLQDDKELFETYEEKRRNFNDKKKTGK